MSEYRLFKLINSVGAEYDLCDPNHFFAYPDGLGFEREIDSFQVGSAFVSAEDKPVQKPVTGEMIFLDYGEYSVFKQFISGSGLVLGYQPAESVTWYYRTVKVSSLAKGEISHTTGRLHCSIDFMCFSQWYESVYAERTNQADTSSVFPLEFPFTFVDAQVNEVNIQNDTSSLSPCKIVINGPCENPRWILVSNGKTVANGEVTITLASGEALIVDSNIETMRITKVADGQETNVYQNSVWNTDRFIYAPVGVSTLRFAHSSNDPIDVLVEVRKVADTV